MCVGSFIPVRSWEMVVRQQICWPSRPKHNGIKTKGVRMMCCEHVSTHTRWHIHVYFQVPPGDTCVLMSSSAGATCRPCVCKLVTWGQWKLLLW